MHPVNKLLQEISNKFQNILFSRILIQWCRILKQKKALLVLALALLGCIVLKLTLGRPIMVTLQGDTILTPYHIQYLDRWGRNHQEEIEDLLVHLHESLCTYLPGSELSRFNEHDCSEFCFESPFFYPLVAKSKEVYRSTAGAFDPTVLPLVNAWEGSFANATYPDIA